MAEQSLQQQIDNLPVAPGVYIFRDSDGEELYVGKSVRLRERVRSYFQTKADLGPRTSKMVGHIGKIDHIQTETELEALLLEADLIKRLKPEYNIQWRDDKRYKYIEVKNGKLETRNEREQAWPWVTTSRRQENPDSLYFGPFPEGRTVNRVLKTLRKIFPWCKYKDADALKRVSSTGSEQARPCFYYHINQCPGICAGKISLQEYWEIIDDLVEFLSGNKDNLIEKYQAAMRKASKEENFERAARFRDKLRNLEYITQQFRESSEYIENPNLIQDVRAEEIRALERALNQHMKHPMFHVTSSQSFRVEGYDISNISADHTTAARVVFTDGEPDKSEYRRYKIKLKNTPDDVAAIREVLSRRFKGISGTDAINRVSNLPDLILIDGGKGQVSAALEVLAKKNLAGSIPVIGLAKKEEALIIPSDGNIQPPRLDVVELPPNSPALQLLQRVRDEAHRFAQGYHRYLRRKKALR